MKVKKNGIAHKHSDIINRSSEVKMRHASKRWWTITKVKIAQADKRLILTMRDWRYFGEDLGSLGL